MVQLLGKEIGSTGYGLMGLTWRSKPQPVEDSIKAMKAALDAGCNLWNGGVFYGTPDFNSLHLLEKYFTKYPEDADKVVISIKGGLNTKTLAPDGTPEFVRSDIETCLKILNGKKKLDIYECARVDPDVPIEATLKAIEEFVKAGKLGGISLSEVGAATIQEAAKITTIVACEVEVSLIIGDVFHNGVAKACADNDILMVAYSPLGRQFLTGELTNIEDIPEDDFRRYGQPRFRKEYMENNLKLVKEVKELAKAKGCTGAQIAVNWVKTQSKRDGNPEIIPIPGATTVERIVENSTDVSLNDDDMAKLSSIMKEFPIQGGRYNEDHQKYLGF